MTAKALFRCSILVVCILVLFACGLQPNPNGDSPTGQTTDSTAQATQNMQIPLNWQSAIINVELKDTSYEPQIFRLTYDSYRELINTAIQKHGDNCHVTCIIRDNGECATLSRLNNLDYSEEFFSENTLLLFSFSCYPDPFAVSNVTREGNIVTCTVDIYNKPLAPDEGLLAWTHDVSVFVAVDTVLPQETEFRVSKNYVPVEAEEHSEISNDFFVKYCQ